MQNYDIVFIVKIFYKTSNVDFIVRNILHFNKNNKVLLLLNIAEYLYDKLNIEEFKAKYPNVVLFRCKAYRTKFDSHVIQCVTNCMNYILENILCKYIILNHDSEVYIKQVDEKIIEQKLVQCKKVDFNVEQIEKNMNTFWWSRFKELTNMYNYFIENKIVPQLNVCPGLIMPYETLKIINKDINNTSQEFYLNSERRVLLDEVIYYSFISHYECKYYNSNYTYWANDDNIKREGLKTEDDTLKELQYDIENNSNRLHNIFSIKKSYKSVCEYIDKNLMRGE